MARNRNGEQKEQIITRTFTETKCTVLCMNTETVKGEYVEIILAESFKDERKERYAIEREVAKLNRPELVVTLVQKREKVETLRGITASDFLKYSVILPPRKDYTKAD